MYVLLCNIILFEAFSLSLLLSNEIIIDFGLLFLGMMGNQNIGKENNQSFG